MLKLKYIRAATVAAAFSALVLSTGARPQKIEATPDRQPFNVIAPDNLLPAAVVTSDPPVNGQSMQPESTSTSPDPLSTTSTFYTVRSDLRKCMSPMCGGYFVKRVNLPLTRCANGQDMAECYVAEIDWNGQAEVDAGRTLLRGSLLAKTYGARFGNLGMLRVNESWQAVGDDHPPRSPKYPVVDDQTTDSFYLVRDRGVVCIVYPCPTHHEAKLNSTLSQNIAGVDLSGASLGANDQPLVHAAMTGPDAAIIKGHNVPVSTSQQLKATRVYLRVRKSVSTMKPCIKTGCSSQVCSDHDVITTCEWRPEYACYQKATCERQADGNCGFTQTPALRACLGK